MPVLEYPFAWHVFSSLSQSRPVGFAPGGIQPSAFNALCDIYRIEDREDLWDIIQIVDREFLTQASKKWQKPPKH